MRALLANPASGCFLEEIYVLSMRTAFSPEDLHRAVSEALRVA
jgi:hypothetical protein